MKTRSFVWTLGILSLCAGCSSSSSGVAADGGAEGGINPFFPDGGASSGSLSLKVDSSTAPRSTLDGFTASNGNGYVVLALTLSNESSTTPLSANPVLFSLRTDRSLVIAISSAQPTNPCNPAFSVATGGTLSCNLAFEVPKGQTPADLLYDDLRGNKATAPVPAPAPVTGAGACSEMTSWYSNPSAACESCLGSAGNDVCTAFATKYTASCNACSQTCGQNDDPCTCERTCDTSKCQGLFDAYMKCFYDACSGSCP